MEFEAVKKICLQIKIVGSINIVKELKGGNRKPRGGSDVHIGELMLGGA